MSDDPRELARRLAAEAKAKADAAKAAAAAAKAAPAKGRSIFDRAPKPKSAQDALAAALAAEKAAVAAPKPAPAPKAAKPAAKAKPAPKAAPVATPAPAPRAPSQDPATLIAKRLPGASVKSVKPVSNPDAVAAVWTAHRVRAATEGDRILLVAADVLVDAAGRLPVGALVGAEVEHDGTPLAVFVDADAGVLLAAVEQPALYLAGL